MNGKSKVMIFKRKEVVVVDMRTPHTVSVPVQERCEVVLGGEIMEELGRERI